ncbi:MAG: M48 family metalloprotease [Desulfovibrionaceae bacterium]|nr:M48 family metalloprotease [Desulfovibrionaceae bacterium]
MGSGINQRRPRFRLFLYFLAFFQLLPTPAAAEITLSEEVELGRNFNIFLRSSKTIVKDPEVTDYVEYLLQRILTQAPPQPFRFSINVIRDDTLNAFAAPGGYIFLHTGLILNLRNEAETAGVLAHELAHVTQRHIARRIGQARKIGLLTAVGALAGVFLAGSGDALPAIISGSMAAGHSAMLGYSRIDENEADQLGYNYFMAAGYPPESMVEAFRIIQRPQWITGTEIPVYLSTHPDMSGRIADITARIQRASPNEKKTYDNERFLRIQTLIRGRYANPETALQFFTEQRKGAEAALACLGFGLLYERTNRIADARQAFEEALRIRPEDPLFLREAGRFNYLKGDRNAALMLLQQATAKNPGDYLAMFYYARLLADAGQKEQAIDCYKQILRRQPEESETHYYYAQVLGKSGQLFQAHLHLAYSALYENNAPKTEQNYLRLRSMVKNDTDKEELLLFEKKYAERRSFWQ